MSEEQQPLEDEPAEAEEQSPLEQFIFHQRRGLEEFGKAMESLLPPGFKEHTQAAGNEFASGFRILIDAAIDEIKKASEMEDPDGPMAAEAQERQARANLEKEEDGDADSASGRIKVEVED